jgi:spermidine synthase
MPQTRLVQDRDRLRSWTLLIDDVPHSHVDLGDPEYLEFEYIRRLGHVLDTARPGPLRVLHLGAGALTLARYLAATRPGSAQLAIDNDPELIELVRAQLPLPRGHRIRVRIGDARAELDTLRDAFYDIVIADVFTAGRTPASLTSAEFAAGVARVLREDGIFAANVADGPAAGGPAAGRPTPGRPTLAHARRQAATIRAVFPHACLIADAAVLRGRRFGNLILAASRQPLPVSQLTRRTAADPLPGRVLDDDALVRFAAGAKPVTDATAHPSPAPPRPL